MNKTLHLHIGLPKTGTTAIQHFLSDSEHLLNELGYCYPETAKQGHEKGHHLLPKAIPRKTNFFTGQRDLNRLAAEMSREASGRNLIISSEGFTNVFNHTYGALKRIKKAFNAYEIHVYFVIRRADEFYESMYFQSHRGWMVGRRKNQLPTLKRHVNWIMKMHFSYLKTIEYLAASGSPFTVIDYSKTVLPDFLSHLGIPHEEQKITEKNKSLSQSFLCLLNTLATSDEWKSYQDVCLKNRKLLFDLFAEDKSSPHGFLTLSQKKSLMEAYNERIEDYNRRFDLSLTKYTEVREKSFFLETTFSDIQIQQLESLFSSHIWSIWEENRREYSEL